MNRAHPYCHCPQAPAQPGEALTRRAITAVTAAIVLMTFAFSLGNVTQLCLNLGITAWIAWLVGPAVDLSVVGLLTEMRFLSLHGYTPATYTATRPPSSLACAGCCGSAGCSPWP